MIEGKLNETGASLLYGQVGGGPGSFIGPVHRAAIAMNNQAKLAAGSFSDIPSETVQVARDLGIDADRAYADFRDMAVQEGARTEGRIDFVIITVPNHIHFAVAKAFLEQGINVVCEKPMAFTEQEAKELVALAGARKADFMVTYTYTGYPMVREARNLVRTGALGTLRVVAAEYPQDWLADPIERGGTNRQAVWRTDPKYAGVSCCVGDIGTHIENLVHFITGLEIDKLAASLETFVEGRPLDDNAYMLLKYKGGASGNYWSSQVAIGKENGLRIRVYGTDGAIEWEQENPNVLRFQKKGGPLQLLTRGNGYLSAVAGHFTRLPAGHPEGYFEAFANLYRCFCNVLTAKKQGKTVDPLDVFPTVVDGARGTKFVFDCVKSSKEGAAWVDASFDI
jgi:predicted dehydrogenase